MNFRLTVVLVGTWILGAGPCLQQGRAQAPFQGRYQPATPTISPYLNLFRQNVGPLPNYYSLVRPQLNQMAFNNQQAAWQNQQSAAIHGLEAQAQQAQSTAPTGKNSWFMTNGRATYMNTGQYFRRAAGGTASTPGGQISRAPISRTPPRSHRR